MAKCTTARARVRFLGSRSWRYLDGGLVSGVAPDQLVPVVDLGGADECEQFSGVQPERGVEVGLAALAEVVLLQLVAALSDQPVRDLGLELLLADIGHQMLPRGTTHSIGCWVISAIMSKSAS